MTQRVGAARQAPWCRPSYGRLLLVERVLSEGWTVVTAAEAQGVSRATGHKWVARFRHEGAAGLADRSSHHT